MRCRQGRQKSPEAVRTEPDPEERKGAASIRMNIKNPYIQYMYSYPHKTAYGRLNGISLRDYASCLAGPGHGLYVHLPFCRTKCGYCNLFSVTGLDRDPAQIDRYLEAVRQQCLQYEELLKPYGAIFSEVVVGGGTPLLLTEDQLARLFGLLEAHAACADGRELIVETAPNETVRSKLEILKAAGATRVSMGIQSFSDEELGTLNRRHSARRAREALGLLKDYDFPCVNVDFIYGIPGQTTESLLKSLKEALAFAPDEIFLYPLYVKHGAGLQKAVRDGMVLDSKKAVLQYREASGYLRSEGFRQDSMRRFVRATRARTYSECGFGTSLALGCGGRSYLGNLHFCSPYAITREDCLDQLAAFERTEDFTEITHGILLTEEEQRRRYVIRHLLIRPGLLLPRYQEHFGTDAMEDFPILKDWQEQDYVRREGTFLTLTDGGLELSDWLGPQLISRTVRERMEEWERMHQ